MVGSLLSWKRERISRRSYRKTKQNVVLAFLFNGLGIRLAATALVYPVWAMVAMAVSVSGAKISPG
jgi:cation transport ATPase